MVIRSQQDEIDSLEELYERLLQSRISPNKEIINDFEWNQLSPSEKKTIVDDIILLEFLVNCNINTFTIDTERVVSIESVDNSFFIDLVREDEPMVIQLRPREYYTGFHSDLNSPTMDV